LLLGISASVVAAACGARSELDQLPPAGEVVEPSVDAGRDAEVDAPVDAPEDAPEDARPDAPPECDDPATTWIYLISSERELVAYKPELNQFKNIGTLNCPGTTSGPFSMAVDFDGIAYVLYQNGRIYKVSTLDASCESTPFLPGPFAGSALFGMGFERDPDGINETLYVAEIDFNSGMNSQGLGRIDHFNWDFEFIGPFSQNPGNAIELTPTGDGPLWGYFLDVPGPGGTLVEIDTNTGDIVQAFSASAGSPNSALAVAWWGGAFYVFTSGGSGTTVTRVDPFMNTEAVVTTTGLTIVGAGVSTCAPTTLP
jgi:hypothetical protein